MIDARELRIVNYVTIDNEKSWPQLKDKPLKCIGISRVDEPLKLLAYPKSTHSITVEDEDENQYSQFNEFIKPIQLTEEILLKCGFEKVIIENYPAFLFEGFMIEIHIDNCVVCYNKSEITKIKFVHSLQNLYFSIKLKELLCDNI